MYDYLIHLTFYQNVKFDKRLLVKASFNYSNTAASLNHLIPFLIV